MPARGLSPLIAKREFIADIGAALASGRGFAAGKIGYTEQAWMYYPLFLAGCPDARQVNAYHTALKFHFERQAGAFPSDPEFFPVFTAWYGEHVRNLDCLGLFRGPKEPVLFAHYGLPCKPIFFGDMQPDRSVPSDEAECYLRHFQGKRLLLLAPFADLLRQRATRDIFEAVWSNIRKPWFHPASVQAIEFPYGYDNGAYAPFPTVIDLFEDVAQRIDRHEFDVALIGAGALGIPLASHIKRSGRVAISLGGHLQVLFGVMGQRWRDNATFVRKYLNDNWIDMPERYHPPAKERLTDGGSYW
jgi:hypothetical protein